MIETMDAQTGRVGVIVPHGVLFRGSAEGKIRRQLVEENLLDAVIGLPPNLFYGTGIPAAILVFKRNKVNDTVLFIDASREFEQGTNQNRLRGSDIATIIDTYRHRVDVEKLATIAIQADIVENDFNLNIPRYVDTFEEEEAIDIREAQRQIWAVEKQLFQVQQRISQYWTELGIDEA